ncbi:MAG: flagellar biosynthetic protein FliQ [Pseudomonadota bacterium]
MSQAELLDMLRQALWITFMVSAPILVVALVVGLAIGLLQALTSIQEMTLTFVPKLAAILAAFWLTMAFSGQLLVNFYIEAIIPRIAS